MYHEIGCYHMTSYRFGTCLICSQDIFFCVFIKGIKIFKANERNLNSHQVTSFPAIIVRYVRMSNTNASSVHNGNVPRNCIGKRCFVTIHTHTYLCIIWIFKELLNSTKELHECHNNKSLQHFEWQIKSFTTQISDITFLSYVNFTSNYRKVASINACL